jgi:nucleotide-binding universal stress UspA family protein
MTARHDLYDDELRPRQLIVGVDDSPGSRAALAWALDQARSTNAQVLAVNVVEAVIPMDFAGAGFYTTTVVDSRALRRAAHDLLDRAVREVARGRSDEVRTHVIEGHNPGQVLVRAARDASLLVVGTHHRHGLGFLLGSTAASCVRHATCPVVVVPEPRAVQTAETRSDAVRVLEPAAR